MQGRDWQMEREAANYIGAQICTRLVTYFTFIDRLQARVEGD